MASKFQLPGEETKPLAIVGGGFAGTATLLHTILNATNDPAVDNEHPLRITLIERHPQQLRGGVAYGKVPNFDHKLNLSSKRITPFMRGKPPAGFPTFDEYLEQRAVEDPSMVENFANPKRKVYGEYLDRLIDIAMEQAGGKVKVDTRFGEVIGFDDKTPGNAVLYMKDGSKLPVMHAIMAVGNKDAAKPSFVFNIAANSNYLDSAYSGRANGFFKRVLTGHHNTKGSSTLIIGTGLSAMDNAMRLIEGGYKGKITMVSRHGEMHPVYRPEGVPLKGLLKGEPRPESQLEFTQHEPRFVAAIQSSNTFDHLFRRMQVEFTQLQKDGYTGEEIVNHWERFTSKIYERFPDEAIKYLTAHKTELNVTRVGTVPEVADRLKRAVKSGQLEILPGDVNGIVAKGGKFVASITPNNHDGKHIGDPESRRFSLVLNGIGFDNRFDHKPGSIKDPFWANLEKNDGFQPHVTHAGVAVTEDFTLMRRDGKPYHNITMVGVPIAGHMTVTPYPYPEKEGEGTRIAAFTLNIQGILGGVLNMIERKYEHFRDMQQEEDTPATGIVRKRQQQYQA